MDKDSNQPAESIPNRRKNRIKDADFVLEKEIQTVEIDCHQRIIKIRQNTRMKDVTQLKEVPLNEIVRPHASEIRVLHQVEAAAELRIREILDGQMSELRVQRDLRALEQLRSHFQHREWTHIKAIYPLLYREAENESEKLVVRLEYETNARRNRRPGR